MNHKFWNSLLLLDSHPTTKGEWRISLVASIRIWTRSIPVSLHQQELRRRMRRKMISEGRYKSKHKLCTILYLRWKRGKNCYHAVKSALASYWTLGCKSVIPPVLQPSFHEMMKINNLHRCFLHPANTSNRWNDAVNVWRNNDRMSLLIRMLWHGINRIALGCM